MLKYIYFLGIGRGASTKQLIAYLKAQLKNSKSYNRMKLMAVGLQVSHFSLIHYYYTCYCSTIKKVTRRFSRTGCGWGRDFLD